LEIPLYQIDAFTDSIFGGNPAAVCPLIEFLPDETMQVIAAENNLAETAFFIPRADTGDADYDLRWFTPASEVDLCGHATLATAHLILTRLDPDEATVRFQTRSGILEVSRDGDLLTMDFPAQPAQSCAAPEVLAGALGVDPESVLANSHFYLAVLADEGAVLAVKPDMAALASLDREAVCITAPGQNHDFVSRMFAPRLGIPEDPVTGAAHCMLTPYWAERLGKDELRARQVSSRGGDVGCRLAGDRVRLSGQAVFYLEGIVTL